MASVFEYGKDDVKLLALFIKALQAAPEHEVTQEGMCVTLGLLADYILGKPSDADQA